MLGNPTIIYKTEIKSLMRFFGFYNRVHFMQDSKVIKTQVVIRCGLIRNQKITNEQEQKE